jgi:hypothetical protein
VCDQGVAGTEGKTVQDTNLNVPPHGQLSEGRFGTWRVEQLTLYAGNVIAVAKSDTAESTDGFGRRLHAPRMHPIQVPVHHV